MSNSSLLRTDLLSVKDKSQIDGDRKKVNKLEEKFQSLHVFWSITTFMYSSPVSQFVVVFHFVFLLFFLDLYTSVSPPGIGVVTPVNQTSARPTG